MYALGLVSTASLAFGTAGATEPDPFDPRTQDEAGSILAWFDHRSYAPGDLAMLHFLRGAPAKARLTVLRIGPKRGTRSSQNDMAGAVVRIEGRRVAESAGGVGGGGSDLRIEDMTSLLLAPVTGAQPVTISYRTTPRLNRSER